MTAPAFPAMFRGVFAVPALLAALTLFGLLAALLGEGVWRWCAWGALALPLLPLAGLVGRARRLETRPT